ncbi:bile acid:sodium symporter family protein [Pseudaestuariivita rosea]|uniref:bile acid:sodium symporter family protein n=1 Tax=Pseudaestuariivita rosea TaxID=2763263 RepID=UPI001ABBD99F|nr:bile acid:sodium symporter family protein [Pseudaestuariivita rosea]
MDILLNVALPLSLAFIMFSLGIGLTLGDFARVVRLPKAFLVGAFAQVVVLPVMAFLTLLIVPLPPELAIGVMILSFCPGGVTSNILTKLSGGALALSITLTAVVSILAVITVPLLVAWSAEYFMGDAEPAVDVTALALAMFLITTVPVALGLALRYVAPRFTIRFEAIAFRMATFLFLVIIIAALAANWQTMIDNLPRLGPVLIALNLVLMLIGLGLARLFFLKRDEGIAIAMDTGIQNGTLGITVGSLIAEAAGGLPPFSLPSGVYGITMYLVALPFVFWFRRQASLARQTKQT